VVGRRRVGLADVVTNTRLHAGVRCVGGRLSRSHASAWDRPGRMRVERSLQIIVEDLLGFKECPELVHGVCALLR
jgi:hypothetical protein